MISRYPSQFTAALVSHFDGQFFIYLLSHHAARPVSGCFVTSCVGADEDETFELKPLVIRCRTVVYHGSRDEIASLPCLTARPPFSTTSFYESLAQSEIVMGIVLLFPLCLSTMYL
mmetsp:Transcript_25750/g.56428  ORF Transcript_25750/g.56428 Transcript_25750/m.56428 type:complete len:116 (+) Transcript_25750:1993-2340(+)